MKDAVKMAVPAIQMAETLGAANFGAPGGRVLPRMTGALMDWFARASQRRRLQDLDERMLADIGLTRADAEQESRKPFWLA